METRGIFEPPASDGRGPCWGGGPRTRGADRRGLTSCHGAAMAFHRRLLLDARVITGEPPLARLASRADTVLRIGRDRQLKQGRDQPACRACPRRPWRLPGQAPEPMVQAKSLHAKTAVRALENDARSGRLRRAAAGGGEGVIAAKNRSRNPPDLFGTTEPDPMR